MSSRKLLDIDESIIEKNLLIQSNKEQEFDQYISGFLNPNSGKVVKPHPGICIKTFKTDDKSKVFINLCHHNEIPPPEDITSDQLIEALESKDPERYCVPLSIGSEHKETDKSGVQAVAYDVAINSGFFTKCENDELFKTFIVSATLEAIAEKFNIEISSENPILLKNRKCVGSLQQHRIHQRPPRSSTMKKKCLIEEINPTESSSVLKTHVEPEYRVYIQPEVNPEQLIVDVWLPDVNNSQEINLKCGEDCIVLTTKNEIKYELDICFPYKIKQQNTSVTFNTITKILSMTSTIN